MSRRWIVSCLTLAVVAIATGLALTQAQTPAEQPLSKTELAPREWITDYGAARREARRLGLPLIVHFHTSWCGPCRKMEREFLGTPAMRDLLGEKFVGVKIDGDREEWLVKAFRVGGFPADVVVAPGGRILNSTSGQKSKSQYFHLMNQVLKQNAPQLQKARALALVELRQSSTIASSEPNPRPPVGSERPATTPPTIGNTIPGSTPGPASTPPPESRPPIVGLNGYSPVSITADRKWIRGRKELAATHQGVVYYLASEKEQRRFQQSPQRFVPRMLGCDPVELWRSDRAVQGSVQFGAFFDKQLYLFTNSETRNEFKRDPLQYIRMRHALKATEIF